MGHYECVLTLTDTRNASHHIFSIDVLNFPPRFVNNTKPKNVRVRLNQKLEVEMPTIIDTENNPHYVVQQLPSFIKYQNGKYLIHAKFPGEEIGYHLVRGIITDSQLSTPFKFRVQVFNDPPDFETPLVDQIAYLGEKSQYLLPEVVENEGLKYSVAAKLENGRALPSFIKIIKK